MSEPINPATRPRPFVYLPGIYARGTYVVATKYSDGDPGDQWCVGFYYGAMDERSWGARHVVVNDEGMTFRHNGFRRVQRIAAKRGTWIVQNIPLIQRLMDRYSIWHWVRAPWVELNEATAWEALGG